MAEGILSNGHSILSSHILFKKVGIKKFHQKSAVKKSKVRSIQNIQCLLHLAVVSAGPGMTAGILGQLGTRGVKTNNADNDTQKHQNNVAAEEENLLGAAEPTALHDIKPHDTGKSVTEPRSKESGDEAEQVAEVGDRFGQDPCDEPDTEDDGEPGRSGDHTTAVEVLGTSEDTDVDVLGGNVTEDDTGDDDGGQGDTPGDLGDERRSTAQGRAGNHITSEVVDDNSSDQVKGSVNSLKGHQGLGVILGVTELTDEAQPCSVSTVGEDNVGDAIESGREVGVGDVDDVASLKRVDTNSNHGDHDGGKDRDERSNGQEGHILHRTRNGKEEEEDQTDDTKDNAASSVVGKSVHGDDESQHVRSHAYV